MLSNKLFVYTLYLAVIGFNVATFDVPNDNEDTVASNELHGQNQQQQGTPHSGENVIVEFILKYSGSWAPYLTQVTSDFGEGVSDMVFHLLDKLSSFPLTALETFCVASICLLFFAVKVTLNSLRGQSDRVAALEKENGKLRENDKMNRILVNELMAETKQPVINDLRDKIQDIEDRQNSYSEYRVIIDTSLYNMKQEIDKHSTQIQELHSRHLNSQIQQYTNTDTSYNNNSNMMTQTHQYQNCQQLSVSQQDQYQISYNQVPQTVSESEQNQFQQVVSVHAEDQSTASPFHQAVNEDIYELQATESCYGHCSDEDTYCLRQPVSDEISDSVNSNVCESSQTQNCQDVSKQYCDSGFSQSQSCEEVMSQSSVNVNEPCDSKITQDVQKLSDTPQELCQFQSCEESTYHPRANLKKSRKNKISKKDTVSHNNCSSEPLKTESYQRDTQQSCQKDTQQLSNVTMETSHDDNFQKAANQPDDFVKNAHPKSSKQVEFQLSSHVIESQNTKSWQGATDLPKSHVSELYQTQGSSRNQTVFTNGSSDSSHGNQTSVSYDELLWYTNELIHSCNSSYVKIQGLQKSHRDLFRFVDSHFGRIFQELDYLAAYQRKQTDTVVAQRESHV